MYWLHTSLRERVRAGWEKGHVLTPGVVVGCLGGDECED